MHVSLIIPTYNGKHKLKSLLSSLEKQTYEGFERIVVIDGSTDGTFDFLSKRKIIVSGPKILNQENKGRAAARNAGARASEGELLVFFDDDMILDSHVLGQHLQHHENTGESILVGLQIEDMRLVRSDIQKYKARLSRKWMNELGTEKAMLSRPFITGAHFSIPKNLFESLGGFNENLRDCEDYELALRATQAGIPIYFDPGIVAWHGDFITAHSYARRLGEYKKAFKSVADLHDLPENPARNWKSIVYYFFSFRFWLTAIDREMFMWLPEKLRYKLYDIIFQGHSIFS